MASSTPHIRTNPPGVRDQDVTARVAAQPSTG